MLLHDRQFGSDLVGPPRAASPREGLAGSFVYARAAFPLAEGTVYLNFPEQLTSDGYAELAEYLAIFLKRAERAKRISEAQEDFKDPPQ
ncbi:hypothetical protein [uncultured Phenylobacterium sp.]|uniref:hypothetical protein n=1 Tax=uncultured Phenylobacterium sp. TaxID=349273 RepID=UPI0025F7DB53|nr:hypothetical protein [uncultured Phenylobacterium sp.]